MHVGAFIFATSFGSMGRTTMSSYQPGAVRYDVAERSNFFLAPIAAASLELVTSWGPTRIQDYCRRLTAGLIAEASELGFSVEDERWRGAHLFGLRMPEGIDLAGLKGALERRGVYASLRGTALRLSPNPGALPVRTWPGRCSGTHR